MWLVFPVCEADIQATRRGTAVLIAGSTLWYLTLGIVLAIWTDPVMSKVRGKFGIYDDAPRNWTPFLILLGAFALSGLVRLLGYRLSRNVAGAVGAGDGIQIALLGGLGYLLSVGTVYLGFTGLLGIATALCSALELKFLRYPAALFGMVVSPRAVRLVSWYFYARTAWLGIVISAGLTLLAAHILNDLPRPEGSPTDQLVHRYNAYLHPAFNALAGFAVLALPFLTAAYWVILIAIARTARRLLDPNGPVVAPEPPVKEGFDQLKNVLHNPLP